MASKTQSFSFVSRHIGPTEEHVAQMLRTLELNSLEELTVRAVPPSILARSAEFKPLFTRGQAPGAENVEPLAYEDEAQSMAELRSVAEKNRVYRSLLGMGYSDTIVPGVIQRNILENPGWYTQYTPYQAEISQGRLEALLNFQTLVSDLTGLPVANASLLDEATACAEAMFMSLPPSPWIPGDRPVFLVSDQCHPQNIEVVRTRAEPLGVEVIVADLAGLDSKIAEKRVTGLLVQNPGTDGVIHDYTKLFSRAHANSTAPVTCIVSGDPMAIVLAQTPAEMGADIAVGTMQRFGVPLGFGGPHAGYMACKEDRVRKMPGRIIGVSKDVHGRPGFRLALQTREQHIRRDKATSNICTAQALLAIMASMYAVYHGPEGLRAIARRIHDLAVRLANGLDRLGYEVSKPFFDTLKVRPKSPGAL
ncbi:MAG: glycine dehydrogenase, partial [Bdellovibrionota bacterium]